MYKHIKCLPQFAEIGTDENTEASHFPKYMHTTIGNILNNRKNYMIVSQNYGKT
jgi:ribose 5-phosphate isomerase RpiB